MKTKYASLIVLFTYICLCISAENNLEIEKQKMILCKKFEIDNTSIDLNNDLLIKNWINNRYIFALKLNDVIITGIYGFGKEIIIEDTTLIYTDDNLDERLSGLDNANYNLNQDTRAYGINISFGKNTYYLNAFGVKKILVAQINNKLKTILSTNFWEQSTFREIDSAGNEKYTDDETSCVLIISNQKTNGFKDILLKCKEINNNNNIIVHKLKWNKIEYSDTFTTNNKY